MGEDEFDGEFELKRRETAELHIFSDRGVPEIGVTLSADVHSHILTAESRDVYR